MEQEQAFHYSVVLDMRSLAQELNEKLRAINSSTTRQPAEGNGSPTCVIGKVADLTRNVDEDQYDPHLVSIGPYHYGPSLAREDDKLNCLRDVLRLLPPGAGTLEHLEGLLGAMEQEQLESRARICYAHSFPSMTAAQFARMLLLDGSYILVRFGRWTAGDTAEPLPSSDAAGAASATPNGVVGGEEGSTSSSMTRRSGKLEDVVVVRDVWYLAENQIPFFVIETIHRLLTDGSTSAVDKIVPYARKLLRRQLYATSTPEMEPPPSHLLHLLHMHLTCTTSRTGGSRGGVPVGRWRTATQYTKAGVTFKKRDLDTNPGCLLDVKLINGGGTLEIPRLNVDAETWRLLRNLMALEQHNPDELGSRVTAYCVFMSQVACTADAVALLSKAGVVSHLLGNDLEVAGEFTNLCKGVVFDVDDPEWNYLRSTCQALEQRFQSLPRNWMAWLKQKYFRNPWLTIGLVATSIVLACAVVDAVYSVLSYKKGAS